MQIKYQFLILITAPVKIGENHQQATTAGGAGRHGPPSVYLEAGGGAGGGLGTGCRGLRPRGGRWQSMPPTSQGEGLGVAGNACPSKTEVRSAKMMGHGIGELRVAANQEDRKSSWTAGENTNS